MIDNINEILNNFTSEFALDKNGQPSMEYFKYTRQLLNIAFANFRNLEVRPYKKKIPLKRSIENALDFLGNLDEEYGTYLDYRLKDGTIEFIPFKQALENGESLESYSTYDNGKRKIHIVYEENISDTFTIIHEILHDTNMLLPEDYNIETDYLFETRDMFTEMISFLGTYLAKKYFKEKYPNMKEIDKDLVEDYCGLYIKCLQTDFALDLLERFMQNGCITTYDIYDILGDCSEQYVDIAYDYLKTMQECNDAMIFYNERYITGTILADYIVNTEKNPKLAFMELNEMITQYDVASIFNYLDLEPLFDENDELIGLSDESLSKLNKTYKKEFKKVS